MSFLPPVNGLDPPPLHSHDEIDDYGPDGGSQTALVAATPHLPPALKAGGHAKE